MKWIDILSMAVHNLRRRKARTALNLLGIVTGTIIILMTSAGGDGVKVALHAIVKSSEHARQLHINPDYEVDESQIEESSWRVTGEDIEPERRERLEESLKEHEIQKRYYHPAYMKKLDRAMLDRIRKISHVSTVTAHADVWLMLNHGDRSIQAVASSLPPQSRQMREKLIVGETLAANDTDGIVLHEMQAYRLGVASLVELRNLIGKPIKIHLQETGDSSLQSLIWAFLPENETDEKQQFENKVNILSGLQTVFKKIGDVDLTAEQQQLLQKAFEMPESKQSEKSIFEKEFIVRGIFHTARDEDDYYNWFRQLLFQPTPQVYLHPQTAVDLQTDIVGHDSFHGAIIQVDNFDNLAPIEKKLKEMGFRVNSARRIFRDLDREIERVCKLFFYVALAVLGIAALGISNTLVISVMERTPEFGIMKSLGARDSHILMLMFFEGTLLGLIGATMAVALSFALGFVGQGILRNYVEGRFGDKVTGQLFTFSPLAIALSFLLAVFLCSAASLLPAWRAAKLDPVVAMRRS